MALATSPPAPLVVPPTQNTALVLEFRCLYTHDLRRKSKRWQDGFLRFHTFNKRVMVYDLPRNFVGDCHWRGNGDLADGDELELESGGALVQVGEVIGRTEQDLSGLFEKRQRAGQGPETPVTNRGTTPLRRPGAGSPMTLRRAVASRYESPAQLRQRTTGIRRESASRTPAQINLVTESPSVRRHPVATNRPDARPAKRMKQHDAAASKLRQQAPPRAHESSSRQLQKTERRPGNQERCTTTFRQIVELSDDDLPRNSRHANTQGQNQEEGLFVSDNASPEPDPLRSAHPTRARSSYQAAPAMQKAPAQPLQLARAPPRKKLVCEDVNLAPVPSRPSSPSRPGIPHSQSPSPRSKELSKFYQAQMERLQGRKTKPGRRAEELDFLEQSQADNEVDRDRGDGGDGNRLPDRHHPPAPQPAAGVQNHSRQEGATSALNPDHDRARNSDRRPQQSRPAKQYSNVLPPKPFEQSRLPAHHEPAKKRSSAPAAPAAPAPIRGAALRTTLIAKKSYNLEEEEKDEDIGPWSTEAFDLFDWRPEGHMYDFERDSRSNGDRR